MGRRCAVLPLLSVILTLHELVPLKAKKSVVKLLELYEAPLIFTE